MLTLKDNRQAWDRLTKNVVECRGLGVSVGYVGPAGDAPHGALSNAELASIYEFGSPGGKIAEHSFLRASWDAHQDAAIALWARLLGQVIDGKTKPEQALGLFGAWFAGKVKTFIASNQVTPPTKGGAGTTLVDTGQLMNALTWLVARK